MANLEILSPVSNQVILSPGTGGGPCLLQSVQGKGKPCIKRNEVWAYVYDDPTKREPTPNVDAVQVLSLDLNGPLPGSSWCGMADTLWTVRLVPGARNGPHNYLRVWAKFDNEANFTTADSTFTGTGCGGFAGPPALAMAGGRGAAAPPLAAVPPVLAWDFGILHTTDLAFPLNLSQLTGLLAFPIQALELDLASSDDDPIWAAGDAHTGPHWQLRLLGADIARLRLRLNLGGSLVQQTWDCGEFDPADGGIFEPDGTNAMMHRIEVTLP